MTPQETALLTTLLARLKTTNEQPHDPEAEVLIQQTTASQPGTAYYLAQTVLIQDLSLYTAQVRIAELEKNLAETKTTLAAPPSFLGRFFGTTARAAAVPAGSTARSDTPPVNPVPAAAEGDFLQPAALTAAGVVPSRFLEVRKSEEGPRQC